ncbi:MAG: hypothetical protein LBT79_07340, partial [Elusimicrobiota bacterium]|nr:hypothetical protein [Elusimicrobiota bacterium]
MHQINLGGLSEFYRIAWGICGNHLLKQLKGKHYTWLKNTMNKRPSFNDFCFRLDNNIFAVLIEVIDEKGNKQFFDLVSERLLIEKSVKNNVIPCLFTMFYNSKNNTFLPAYQGWNLIDARNRKLLNPDEIFQQNNIVISKWELHDWAVQIVISDLIKDGMDICSFSDMEEIDPSLWFINKNKKINWAVVRYYLYPNNNALLPNLNEIKSNVVEYKDGWAQAGFKYVLDCENPFNGYFAQVGFSNSEDPFKPLMREQGAYIAYKG